MNLNYLKELGYTKNEIEGYSSSWNNNTIMYLAENSDYVSSNMRYLKDDFDHNLLLKLPIFYSETFTLSPELFEKRVVLLKNAFPDCWTDIVEKQFWGYCGIGSESYRPIMSVLGSYDELYINESIKQLQNPQEIVFGFMLLLQKNLEIELSVDSLYDEILWDMKVSKYEIVRNANTLINQGLSKNMVCDIIAYAPYLMMLSESEVKTRLSKSFGKNYISEIQKMDNEIFLDKLEEIAW